jgi:hypothetical protein
MARSCSKIFKLSVATTTLLVCLVFSAISAQADPVTVSGSTRGAFDGAATTSSASLTGTLFGFPTASLDFAGQGFSTSIAGNGTPATIQIANFDLRTFSNYNFNGHTFVLAVNFTAPSVIGGTFTANLSGSIIANEFIDGNETIVIDFDNTPQVFSFSGGFLTFSVADLIVHEQSGFVPLNAQITAQTTSTPEPMSMALMGTGLAGVAAVLRKRRKKTIEPES